MVKGRIDPSALPNLEKDQSDQLKFLLFQGFADCDVESHGQSQVVR
jgi:hypothetical protein